MNKRSIFFILLFIVGSLYGAEKSLQRQFVPIVFTQSDGSAGNNLDMANWTAFRYESAMESWVAVPLQLDERDEDDKYNRHDTDGIVDANDEWLVMPADLGDKAPTYIWNGLELNDRLEMEFTDPLNPDEKAWLYLFRDIAASVPSYIDYGAPPEATPAADTVKTATYHLGRNEDGWFDYLALAPDFDTDHVDRLKLRLAGSNAFFGIKPYALHEDFIIAGNQNVTYTPGAIRSFQRVHNKIDLSSLNLPLIPKTAASPFDFQYFPYSFSISGETELESGILALFGIKTIRQSLDLTPAAKGMTFYSHKNTSSIAIDGAPDDPATDLGSETPFHWMMATGDAGTILLLFDIPQIKKSSTSLYYRDDTSTMETNDKTPDTGDMQAIGDMGVWIQATGDALVTSELAIRFIGYFLPLANQTPDLGEKIMNWQANPVTVTSSWQGHQPMAVRSPQTVPTNFELSAMSPNPLPAGHQSGTFTVKTSEPQDINLVIYNTLGQTVQEWTAPSQSAGTHRFSWDGRNQQQNFVPTGAYFLRATVNGRQQVQKIFVVR